MLTVNNLAKRYAGAETRQFLFENLSFVLPKGGRLAILGRNGQGKSTLIKILGGVLAPTRGNVRWDMRASWPLGFGGAFQGALTGADNIRFISRIYDAPLDQIAAATEDFAQLGEHLKKPVRHYSSGMRARLAFGLSLAIEFDCYLIDEVTAVGDAKFQERCHRELFDRRGDRSFIIASHDLGLLRSICDRAIIIEGGEVRIYDDMDLAADVYWGLCAPISEEEFPPLTPTVAA